MSEETRNHPRKWRGGCVFTFLLTIVLAVGIFVYSLGHSLLPLASINGTMGTSGVTALHTVSGSSLGATGLYSRNAILVDLNDSSVLLQKNSGERIYPASLTKIMTAVVALEHLKNPQAKIKLSSSIFPPLNRSGASLAGFEPNEEATGEDLLYGALLASGAECCVGLADAVAGSEQGFVKLMNQKADELGMSGTHFANTTGLQSKDHYTTVRDLSTLLQYALKNPTFRTIFTTERHTMGGTNRHPYGFTVRNTMFDRLSSAEVGDGEILGGKTGYTDQAGLCLASLAKEGGREYILITAGAKGNHDTQQYNIADALTVYASLSGTRS